jgi:hypothetical protein
VLAEKVVVDLIARVVADALFAGEQAEVARLEDHPRRAALHAHGAVALAGALVEVDVGFETNGAAVAAAGVLGLAHFLLNDNLLPFS